VDLELESFMEPSIHMAERRERRGKRVTAAAFLVVVGLLTAATVGLFGFLEANAAYGTVDDVYDALTCDPDDFVLDFPEIGRLSEVYTSDGVLLGKLSERNSQPIAYEDIPDTVIHAVLAAEDAGFFEHEGIDFKAILRAALGNARGGNLQGGSTITQQIVKTNFLSSEQTLERKTCEAQLAAKLERQYTKEQILEFYMNSVFFGSNAYGVKAAAEEYWDKDLDDVTIAEAAAMVTAIRNPSLYDMRDNPSQVIRARNDVIDQMLQEDWITPREARAARAEPIRPAPPQEFVQQAPQVLIAAREEILRDPDNRYGLGDTFTQRKRALFGCPADDTDCEGGGGLEITVTVDWALQNTANEILRSWFFDLSGPTGAMAMVENETGAIRVMASGLDFGDDLEAGQRPYDLATKGRRQAGSAFKPFALATALTNGTQDGVPVTLNTWWDQTSPQELDCGFPCSEGSNIWTVSNAGGGGSGITTLERATYLSLNTVYAQVSLAVGPDKIADMAHSMGIESPLNPFPSITLGTQSVSPLEMAAAYSTFANLGDRVETYLIEKIVDADGEVIYQHEVEREQVLDQALTRAIVATLEKVVGQGTATRANIGRPQAGKTGTAQNFRDVWFMGFIPQYTTSVWVGYPDAQVELVNFTVRNASGDLQAISRAYGGTVAAPIWKQFMEIVTEDLPVEDWPDVDGIAKYFTTPDVEVPDLTGLTEDEAVDAVRKAGLFDEVALVPSPDEAGTLIGQVPEPGTTVKQGTTVEIRISTGEPAVMFDLVDMLEDNIADRFERFNRRTGLNVTYEVSYVERNRPSDWGRVLWTNPPAGVALDPDVVVRIAVGVKPGSGQ
jgi:membrane peptidoglycan carboxypeptidase